MNPELPFELINVDTLVERARALRMDGFRLAQVSATRLEDSFELTYSFGRGCGLTNLRLNIPAADPRVPSISSIFAAVLLYENEIHDLFGIRVDGMNVDFQGNLYKTKVKFPFAAAKTPPPPAPAPAAP